MYFIFISELLCCSWNNYICEVFHFYCDIVQFVDECSLFPLNVLMLLIECFFAQRANLKLLQFFFCHFIFRLNEIIIMEEEQCAQRYLIMSFPFSFTLKLFFSKRTFIFYKLNVKNKVIKKIPTVKKKTKTEKKFVLLQSRMFIYLSTVFSVASKFSVQQLKIIYIHKWGFF